MAASLLNRPGQLNFDLGETPDMLRVSVEAFAADEIAPRAAEIDRSNEFQADLWRKMGALGVLGITVGEEYGCAGMGYLEHCAAMEEISRASASAGLPYIHERKQFGRPIGEFQLMQGKIADMYLTMNVAKAYVYSVAKACDRGETSRKDAAGAILYAAERATWMALEALQVLGSVGYTNDYPTGRLLQDAKLYEIGAGTSEIRRMLIGRELFEETA